VLMLDPSGYAQWLRVSGTGSCDATITGKKGDCDHGDKGDLGWIPFEADQEELLDGKARRAVSSCLQRCAKCARCRYVSVSVEHLDCAWFATCNLDNLYRDPSGFVSGPILETAAALDGAPNWIQPAPNASDTDETRLTTVALQRMPAVSKFWGQHKYQTMYAHMMAPRFTQRPRGVPLRMLEIGLGCDMGYGPGASAHFWRRYLPPTTVLYMAEIDARCVRKHAEELRALRVLPLVGDQGDAAVRKRWMQESGGRFDFMIDDGSHESKDIKDTFDDLWPHLQPGGVYFLEDLHLGTTKKWGRGHIPLRDILSAWSGHLVVPRMFVTGNWWMNGAEKNISKWPLRRVYERHPKPRDLAFVFCQEKACAVGKQHNPALGY